jgi:uncharacterized protein (DUF697 family)
MTQAKCSTCSVDFSLESEGGIAGNFGIIPIAFCPTCLCSAIDMVHQLEEAYGQDELQ